MSSKRFLYKSAYSYNFWEMARFIGHAIEPALLMVKGDASGFPQTIQISTVSADR